MYRIIRILDIAKKRIRELEDGFKVSIQIMSKIEKRGKKKNSPSFGLTAAGRLFQSRVQVGQGWGENITSMPFS